jgi:hypothetical protein
VNAAPRYVTPLLLIALCAGAVLWVPAHWALWLLVPLALVCLWDFAQSRHSLRRNYPLLARVRWIFEDLRPYLRSYIVESDRDGRPFTIDERSLVYARAKGDIASHPMGTELDVYSEEYEWLGHSIVPREQAPQTWHVRIGGEHCRQPYDSQLLNISAMSFGSLSANAIEALNKGAALHRSRWWRSS